MRADVGGFLGHVGSSPVRAPCCPAPSVPRVVSLPFLHPGSARLSASSTGRAVFILLHPRADPGSECLGGLVKQVG